MGSFAPSTASTQAAPKDMARGRKQGYQNYGAKEELLLCDLASKLLPTGRNMWMALAADYNSSKDPSWRERDFDSLRRKFRMLYGKPKPTGNQGDRLTLKQRAILMAHETQFEIEKKGGAHTSHDGHDNGEDDENLMDEVNTALFADEVDKTFNVTPKGGGDSNGGRVDKQLEESDEEADAEEDDGSVSSIYSGENERISEADTTEEADVHQPRGPLLPPVSELHGGESVSAGAVMTPQGLVPIEFAADFQQTNASVAEGDESDTPVTRQRSSEAQTDRIATPTTNRESRATPRPSTTPTPVTPRGVGRPRRDSQPMASVASPDGPILERNPDRAASDAAEAEKHKRLHATSDRLGGRDLRVLRDNFQAMGGRDPGSKAKSNSASDSSTATTYAAAKRNQAKRRMNSIDEELKKAEAAHASLGSEMKELLLFFREDADRRAEEEAKRRRDERDERRAEEKREREEREQVRRDEAALAEARRQQEREDAKTLYEATEKKAEAARADRQEEEAERRRQFQARLEQDRAEARQRHEQMMLLISTIHKSK